MTESGTDARLIALDAARTSLLQFLLPGETSGSDVSISAEIIRSVIWTHSRGDDCKRYDAVHRRRILSQADSLAAALINTADASTFLSATLDELEAIGEIVRFPQGFFKPAPLRWVHEGRESLLIGAVPTHALPTTLRTSVRHRHLVRTGPFSEAFGIPKQSLVARMGTPEGELTDWFHDILDRHRERARPFGQLGVSLTDAEVYPFGDSPIQYKRWSNTTALERMQASSEAPCLMRRRHTLGNRIWHLVYKIRGETSIAEISNAEVDIRRLMYALDRDRSTPTVATITRIGQMFQLVLQSELPKAEQRLLTALAKRVENESGRYYPRC